MPKVVHVIARMNVGGPAALLVQLLRGLPDQLLLTGQVQHGEADHLVLRAPETPYILVPGLGRSVRLGDDARAFAFLVRELRRLRPDVVHTHTAKAGVLGRPAARLARVPHVVHTFHGHLLHGYFSPWVTRAVVQTERTLARATDRIVAVGDKVRDELLASGVGSATQYVVIPPGVSPLRPPQPRQARAVLGIPPDRAVVAFVGRLTDIKRPDLLLEVAQRLPHVTFIVAGEGPLLPYMRAHASTNVRLLGWRSDVETVYAAADVALLTSENEGMPVSLVEAALCGTPAVSTDVGSAREVVTGAVTRPDPDALAAAICQVIAADLGAAAKQDAERRFALSSMLRAHERLYLGLCDEA